MVMPRAVRAKVLDVRCNDVAAGRALRGLGGDRRASTHLYEALQKNKDARDIAVALREGNNVYIVVLSRRECGADGDGRGEDKSAGPERTAIIPSVACVQRCCFLMCPVRPKCTSRYIAAKKATLLSEAYLRVHVAHAICCENRPQFSRLRLLHYLRKPAGKHPERRHPAVRSSPQASRAHGQGRCSSIPETWSGTLPWQVTHLSA